MTGRASGCGTSAAVTGNTWGSVMSVADIEISVVDCAMAVSPVWVLLVSSPATRCAACPRCATKSWCCVRIALSFRSSGYILPSDDQFALFQVAAFNYFSRSAITQPNLDATRLWLAILAHHPNHSRLTWQHRCAGRSKVALLLAWAGGNVSTIRTLTSLATLPTLTTGLVV